MSLSVGARLGSYEVTAQIGAGGMGEVYRATDTKLKRDVALKVLPAALASDPDRLARFQREAELLATLNHPNIAAIYGLEDAAGSSALVLELVEGETLAERIARSPLPQDDAVSVARQIVDALEAAHEKGVIHRDLKPANVKITPEGKVKVLDFGLAKMLESEMPSASLSMSPTLSLHATYAGVILGTAAYMSPEQARGKAVDRRTDVWAFGCVLFEMLAGKKAFESSGETVSDAVAAVLMKEPDWDALPADTPPHIRALIRRCLQKDVQKRVPHIGVARIEIDDPPSTNASALTAKPAPPQPWWRQAMPVVVGVLLAAGLTSAAWWGLAPDAPSPIVTRFPFTLPDGQNFTNAGRHVLAISPDGTQMVYVANQRLYLRTMSDLEARAIVGIDGTYAVINPVFSPDGRSIAFFNGGDQTIKRIAVAGGAAVTITSSGNPIGMRWGADGIVFGGEKGVMRVSPNGGTPEAIVSVNPDDVASGPQMLPGEKVVLFTLAKRSGTDRWDKAQAVVQSLASGERKTLIEGGSDARYLPTGHLVYALGGVIFAIPFDAQRLEVRGGPVSIVEGVARAPVTASGAAQFSVSANGSLVYVPGPVSIASGAIELALFDRKGVAAPLKVPAGSIQHPRASPDGKQVVFVTDDEKEAVVWVYELSGATSMRRLTFDGRNRYPIWSSDGQHVAFQSDREGDLGIFRQRADGTGTAERLTTADKETGHLPESWLPRGDGFLFRVSKGAVNTLSFYSLRDKKDTPFAGVQSATPTNAVFSPDGRWVTYETSGTVNSQRAVYVQPFPATGATYQLPVVEQGGYRHPLWSPDGKELFYVIGGGSVRRRVAGVVTQPAFTFGNPSPLPGVWRDSATDVTRQYDILPDGQRFIATIPAGSVAGATDRGQTQQILVVLNWFEELKQRVPVR